MAAGVFGGSHGPRVPYCVCGMRMRQQVYIGRDIQERRLVQDSRYREYGFLAGAIEDLTQFPASLRQLPSRLITRPLEGIHLLLDLLLGCLGIFKDAHKFVRRTFALSRAVEAQIGKRLVRFAVSGPVCRAFYNGDLTSLRPTTGLCRKFHTADDSWFQKQPLAVACFENSLQRCEIAAHQQACDSFCFLFVALVDLFSQLVYGFL